MLRFIRCWAGGRPYALDMEWVSSIQRVDQMQRAAGEQGEIGQLRAAGVSVPVWSLAERLGAAAQGEAAAQRVIVLHDPVRPWGILVDGVSPVTAVARSQLFPLPDLAVNREKPYFSGVLLWQDDLLLRLAPGALHPGAPAAAAREAAPVPLPGNGVVKKENGRLPGGRSGQIVVFRLPLPPPGGDFSFALSVTQIPEVLPPLPIIPVPGAPPHVLGLVNWRGRPVTLLEMARWLGLAERGERHGRLRLIIVRATERDELVGFLARPSMRILRLPLPHRPADARLPLERTRLRGAVQNGVEMILVPAV